MEQSEDLDGRSTLPLYLPPSPMRRCYVTQALPIAITIHVPGGQKARGFRARGQCSELCNLAKYYSHWVLSFSLFYLTSKFFTGDWYSYCSHCWKLTYNNYVDSFSHMITNSYTHTQLQVNCTPVQCSILWPLWLVRMRTGAALACNNYYT